jgi:hypothetical protein
MNKASVYASQIGRSPPPRSPGMSSTKKAVLLVGGGVAAAYALTAMFTTSPSRTPPASVSSPVAEATPESSASAGTYGYNTAAMERASDDIKMATRLNQIGVDTINLGRESDDEDVVRDHVVRGAADMLVACEVYTTTLSNNAEMREFIDLAAPGSRAKLDDACGQEKGLVAGQDRDVRADVRRQERVVRAMLVKGEYPVLN